MNANALHFLRRFGQRGLLYAALILLAVPFLFPFWWMFTSAFKTPYELFQFPPPLLPTTFNWSNFETVFTFQPFARQYFNSLYISITVTTLNLLISSLAGYAFARIRFPGSNVIFIILLSALMMPSEVTIVPNYVLMKLIGHSSSHLPLILLPIFGSNGVVTTFMMRQFFLAIPQELEDAARMDGLDRWGMFWKLAMPIARPALAAVAILTFLNVWNSFLEPFIFTNDPALFTLPVALPNFRDSYGAPMMHIQLAATTLSVIPVLVFYIIAQRQVIESFTSSGVKG